MCADCATPIRTYQYRFHPPESASYERCIGFFWCPECRVYQSQMVHVSRKLELVDVLGPLPEDERDRIRKPDHVLVAYLDSLARQGVTWEPRPAPPGLPGPPPDTDAPRRRKRGHRTAHRRWTGRPPRP
ncbi:hypothetical protein [Yinghuangia seranimata]|uniref:hypothetical protein n=1 Tax=Yinghuangia seranimata TaxID=408067 RepID=UPI00248BBE7A|nr:hypothetical protein [Yinghuangia seranimata]MDI2132166.1 hypothetical protein [Yinghuangia seranimata]